MNVSLQRSAANDGAAPDYYTTKKGGPHLPGKPRQWMLRNARTIAGARKLGRDWIVSRSDYERHLRERDAARVRTKSRPVELDDEALADEALRMAGLRKNGGQP